jgi:hypothetical protein
MLECVADETYRRIADEIRFGDAFQFDRRLLVDLARAFEILIPDAQKRIDSSVFGSEAELIAPSPPEAVAS